MFKLFPEKNEVKISPIEKIDGEISICGDKSITHRAIILTSIAKGTSKIINYLPADDVSSTISCLRKLGVEIKEEEKNLIVNGKGKENLIEPKRILDAGNSGTTIRLLAGVLAGQPFTAEITGDDSLRRRPMHRIIEPLEMMGAEISSSKIIPPISMRPGETVTQVLYPDKYPPLKIKGRYPLKPITYNLPIASAQVKSAILLAGLFAQGETTVIEPLPSRDHTERMLKFFGISLKKVNGHISFLGPIELKSQKIEVVGDFSAASFFLALALILPNSKIKIKNVGINPTRTGFLQVLRNMGANISVVNQREICGEPVADILAYTSKLHGTSLSREIIPAMIDEIPLFTLLATQAEGESVISGAEELRYKESDRIETISSQLNLLGAKIKTKPDGLIVQGPTTLRGNQAQSFGDHRIAMTLVIAGLIAHGETIVQRVDCIKISFPDFWETLSQLK